MTVTQCQLCYDIMEQYEHQNHRPTLSSECGFTPTHNQMSARALNSCGPPVLALHAINRLRFSSTSANVIRHCATPLTYMRAY